MPPKEKRWSKINAICSPLRSCLESRTIPPWAPPGITFMPPRWCPHTSCHHQHSCTHEAENIKGRRPHICPVRSKENSEENQESDEIPSCSTCANTEKSVPPPIVTQSKSLVSFRSEPSQQQIKISNKLCQGCADKNDSFESSPNRLNVSPQIKPNTSQDQDRSDENVKRKRNIFSPLKKNSSRSSSGRSRSPEEGGLSNDSGGFRNKKVQTSKSKRRLNLSRSNSYSCGMKNCKSTSCFVDKEGRKCPCKYPPVFEQLSCSGLITGNCKCSQLF